MTSRAVTRLSDLPEVLSVRQVADFLGVAENSVYGSIRRGELPAVNVGRRVLVSKVALSRWLTGGDALTPEEGAS
jgi:excisionase family DNA binding protein